LFLRREDPICTLTINRPEKHNLLTLSILEDMARSLEELAEEDAVRVVVIRGAGDTAFSAGYDITALPIQPTSEEQEDLRRDPPLERALRAIRAFPYPVIAMINGLAYGGGCELAVACDIRVASERTRMGMPPAKLGLVYPHQGLRRFIEVLGLSRTLEIFLTARRYDSASCLRMGLVNEVVGDVDLEDYTRQLATEIAGNAPLSLRGMKSAVYSIGRGRDLDPSEEEALRSMFIRSLQSDDSAEARQAFLEKRKPRFKGK
jgi:enoyl-CoA hydratase/carnithine racemase